MDKEVRPHFAPQKANAPAIVRTAEGHVAFQRNSPSDARLQVEYVSPEVTIDLTSSSVRESLNAACAREIQHMRGVLRQLGSELPNHLKREGEDPVISRKWHNNEERTWQDRGTNLVIAPTRFHLDDRLKGFEGASDAKLVQEYLDLLIQQREQNIRDMYARLFEDLQAQRQHGKR